MQLGLIAVVVSEHDPAISFSTASWASSWPWTPPALTNDGRPKQWVMVRPPGAATGLLLAG